MLCIQLQRVISVREDRFASDRKFVIRGGDVRFNLLIVQSGHSAFGLPSPLSAQFGHGNCSWHLPKADLSGKLEIAPTATLTATILATLRFPEA